nr:hypothetical protein [Tanacetum cinerariifolium]
MQLTSTIHRNKLMVEEVTSLKKDFKQKENKYLKEFLDMKALKEKVEDKLYKPDQSLQTVHMLCKPKSYYDEQNKIAIGYKNPLYLTRAQQVQPTLYSGHEIIKTNHVPAIVHNFEETLEIAETTRKKINDKTKDPECVKKKVKIAPHDYSKENYLATFTPQKQLTSEQIFWSKDLLKMKAEALKEQTVASRPIKALMVYPSNTPTTLVPMKEIFKELEAEVDQNVVHRKQNEIERKNLLIANDNLIVDCLSRDVFYTATDSVLIVSRFSNMHEALSAAQKRIAKLKSKNFNLQNKIQNDDNDVMAQIQENHISNCVTMPAVKSQVLSPGRYVIDIEPIPHRIRNNRKVHLDYLMHLKESVETLGEIIEEAKVEKPLDRSLASAFLYTKHSQKLLEYVIGTCPKEFNQRDKKYAATTVTRKKQVTFMDPCDTSTNNTLTHVKQQTNEHAIPST